MRPPKGILKGGGHNAAADIHIQVWHVGYNDYRVRFRDFGEYKQCRQFGPAFAEVNRLSRLGFDDIMFEVDKIKAAAQGALA